MSRAKPGERVGAICGGGDDGVIEFFGYGVYEGDFIYEPGPDAPVGWMAEAMMDLPSEQRCPNPRIRLDSGQVVWGCECWWGQEEAIRKRLVTAPSVRQVSIDEVRAEIRAENRGETDGQ